MSRLNQANLYTLFGVAFGGCFPLGAIVFLYAFTDMGEPSSFVDLLVLAHQNTLLYVIDTAPLFLGGFARLAGKRQDRIQEILGSLEQQVAEKTESLRQALEEARRANETIGRMADHDSLTGLLNRRRFQKSVEEWMAYAARYKREGTLVFLDLDKFKFVNDTYGHNAGDAYLIYVAKLLAETLRTTDIVARWGGDEFAAFLPETGVKEAQAVGNKLLAAFAKTPFAFEGHSFQGSASIGLACVPEHATNADQLTLYADTSMYEAKKAGRGCWRVYASSDREAEKVQEHLQWESRIRSALENDQFLLLYQPMYNLKAGRTEGYEALLRLEDRGGRLITPGHFLDSAERSNLSTPIDFMVIRKSLRRIAPLIEHGQDVWVSVNLATKTMLDQEILNQVARIHDDFRKQKGHLRLEISELTILQNLGLVRDTAKQLRDQGCVLILDDFGLGPVSLDYLERLHLSMVKLHPSLTRGVLDDQKKRIYLENLTKMLHGLNLLVGAKSVEDERMIEVLGELGVDYAQGFAIGKPLESFEEIAGAPGEN